MSTGQRAARVPVWVGTLVLGPILIGLYFALPGGLPSSFGFDAVGAIAVAVIIVGIRHTRPEDPATWWLFAAGVGCSIAADLVSSLYDIMSLEEPAPSVSDVFYLAAYPFYVLGVMRLGRRLGARGAGASRLDGVIVALGALAVFSSLLTGSYAGDETLSVLGKITLIAYPVMDVALLFIVVNALLFDRVRAPVDTIVAVAMAAMLVSDYLFYELTSHDAYAVGNLVDAGWLLNYWLIGVAALHPSAARLPEPSRAFGRLSWMPAVALAAFTPPLVMLVDPDSNVAVLASISLASGLLITIRMSTMFGRLRAQAGQLQARGDALEESLVAQQQLEADLRHQAFHDTLTGLANRDLLCDRVDHALVLAARGRIAGAVVLLDIDNFKTVNDSLGHQTGDALLALVADRLRSTVRPGDTVARLGGDEFAVFLDAVDDYDQVAAVVERVLDALREPYSVDGRSIALTASAGIAFGRPGTTADALISQSDAAMYAAKEAGHDRFEVFEDTMRLRALEHLSLTTAFRGAIERGEFHLDYQPVLDLSSGRLLACEALVRWDHPALGLLAPARFIELAEETGFIVPLGRWVLETAAKAAVTWADAGGAGVAVSVNVSATQLQDSNIVADVRDVLTRTGLPASRLILEVTESAIVDDIDGAAPMLRDLKRLGVRVAIDDFGTGQSSLWRLRSFPIDILKIDKGFVDQLESPAGTGRAVIEAIIRLARVLSLTTVAEGIETAAQRELLAALGCDWGQGFLLSRPLSSPAALAYLRSRPDAPHGHATPQLIG